MPVICNSFWY